MSVFDDLFADGLKDSQRIPDGLLHPSTHLHGHLRHTQLDLAGAPKRVNPFANSMRLMAGTMFHNWFHDLMRQKGIAHLPEVKLDKWLPNGWAGTADCLLWDEEHQAFALVDYKTIEGRGVYWIDAQGPKESHISQVSAYLYACEAMGIPLIIDEAYVLYVPITEDPKSEMGTRRGIMSSVKPLDKTALHEHMANIKSSTDQYLDSLEINGSPGSRPVAAYLTDALADPPERVQKLFWDKDKRVWHVRYVPPWGAKYCPYDEPLCTCSGLVTTKIGEFSLEGEYTSREGYEIVIPTERPSTTEMNKRKGKST